MSWYVPKENDFFLQKSVFLHQSRKEKEMSENIQSSTTKKMREENFSIRFEQAGEPILHQILQN